MAIFCRNETESPLLRLPGEIRNIIYALVLALPQAVLPRHFPQRRLSILFVCRQIYDDVHLLPFALNTLTFDDTSTYTRFMTVTSVAQRSAITSIIFLFLWIDYYGKLLWLRSGIASTSAQLAFDQTMPGLKRVHFKVRNTYLRCIEGKLSEVMEKVRRWNKDGLLVEYTITGARIS